MTSARVIPTAAWPSCAQACMLPLFTDLKPQMTGKCSGSSVSVVSTLSMSKRSAVNGPGHPVSTSATRPVSPLIFFMISGDAPCLMALSSWASLSVPRPITLVGSMRSPVKRMSIPAAASASAIFDVVLYSAQPVSGYLWRSRLLSTILANVISSEYMVCLPCH